MTVNFTHWSVEVMMVVGKGIYSKEGGTAFAAQKDTLGGDYAKCTDGMSSFSG